MSEAPLWLVTGDKLGDNAQLLVIAEALGRPYEVRRVIRTAGPNGVLLLAGAHNFQPDVSVENLLRVFEIARTDGRYPIDWV